MVFGWGRDEEYVGLTPGLMPVAGVGEVRKVRGGKEWDGQVAPQFHPPAGVGPSLAGTVVDGKVHPRDLGAMIIDLSLRGWYTIEREGEKDFRFTTSAQPVEGDQLSEAELTLLRGIFAGSKTVLLSELKPRLAEPLRAVTRMLYAEVVDRGWYRRHPQPQGLERLLGRSPRTADGTAIRVQTMGFARYLGTAEAEQIKVEEAADLFTRYLPYAMVFGLAKRWAGVIGEVIHRDQLDSAIAGAASVAADPAAWILVDALIDSGAIGGLVDILGGAGDLLGLDVAADAVGGVLGDVFGDLIDGIVDAF